MRGYLMAVVVPVLAVACGGEPAPPPQTDFDRIAREAVETARAERAARDTLPRVAGTDSLLLVSPESVLVAAGYVIKGRTPDGRLIVIPPPERIPGR